MQKKKYIREEKEDNIFHQIASRYLPYWPLFLLAIVIGIAAGYVYLRYTIPVYEATATLIIKDEKKGNEESKMMESLDPISSKKIVENEIEVLQSRRLMADVVNKLGMYAPIYEEGDVNTLSAYTTSPVSVRTPYPDSLISTKEDEKIYLTYNAANETVTLNGKDTHPLDKVIETRYGKLIFSKNKYYQQPDRPVKPLYLTLVNPRYLVPGVIGGLTAEAASKLSSVVNLSYRDQVPLRAEQILNQLINSYRQFEINEKEELAKNTLRFVEERLKLVSHDLDSVEKKIEAYRSSNRAIDISTQGQLYLQNVSANDQKLSEVNTQLSVLNEVEKFVDSKGNKNGIVPSTLGVGDPTLSKLVDQLYTTQLEYDKLRKTVGENNPALISLRDQINTIKPDIRQNIESQKKSLGATRSNIAATSGSYNAMLSRVPEKERQLLEISREQQIKSDIYSFLLQKREESEIAFASSVANNRVVDFAQASPVPVSPKRLVILFIFVLLTMGLCFVIITIKETMTGKILYRNEIENRTSIPIIGEVAHDKSKKSIVIEEGRRSFVAEEFRKLRISLKFLGIDENRKKILITSSISGEGKSFIATNLAISMSLTDKKVILVDTDLNNPTLARMLDVDTGEGVTEYLKGERAAEEVIRKINDHTNLYFISSGQIPENPSELLSNGRIKDLLEYLNSQFDVIIIDTSPIVLVTDGYLLTGLCDATLYVIRHKYTPKMLVKRIDENNYINPIHNPAIIFNGVKTRGFFKNNYGYGYDYVYGNKQNAYARKSLVKS